MAKADVHDTHHDMHDVVEELDDYTMTRVPAEKRYAWLPVAMQRFGQVASFHQFAFGVLLGLHLNFWDAFWAFTLGSVFLEFVTIVLGIIGVREGLPLAVLTRWTGFGKVGSFLVGIMMALALAGWFGVQNSFLATALAGQFPGGLFLWALISGLFVTLIVVGGFRGMGWVAYVAVPLFIILAMYQAMKVLSEHSIGELMNSAQPQAAQMTIIWAITPVAGAFILGALMSPDMTRFNRTAGDVVKQTVTGVTLGQYLIGMTGVLLALGTKVSAPDNFFVSTTDILINGTGWLGILILLFSVLKVNDWNLYSSSLGLINSVQLITGKKMPRLWVTIGLGVLGSLISAVGMANKFVPFLEFLGILVPPVAGVMMAEYFLVHRDHGLITKNPARSVAGVFSPMANIPGLLSWLFGALAGGIIVGGWIQTAMAPKPEFLIPLQIEGITGSPMLPATVISLIVGFVAYLILGKVWPKPDYSAHMHKGN